MDEVTKKEKRSAVAGYILLWFSGVLIYLTNEKSDYVRFHAKQSIVTFLPLTILLHLADAFVPLPQNGTVTSIIGLIMFILWLVCIYNADRGKMWRVPIFGALVDSPSSFLSGDIKSISKRDEKLAALLCYAGLFITGLLFYAFEERNSFVRFHAKQSVLLFLPMTVLTALVYYMPVVGAFLGAILLLLLVILWLVCMLMAYQGKAWKVPFIWEIAEKIGIKAERPQGKDEIYSFALFQFVTKTSELVGEESMHIFRSAIDGYNKRFNRNIEVGTQISFSNVQPEEWPQLVKFVLDIYAQCIGPTTFEIAREIDGLRDFAA